VVNYHIMRDLIINNFPQKKTRHKIKRKSENILSVLNRKKLHFTFRENILLYRDSTRIVVAYGQDMAGLRKRQVFRCQQMLHGSISADL